MGRRKIKMELVEDIGARQVTFSKRRSGIFKKANELATLFLAQVAVIVFSPGGKPYSFGNPSVEAVAERFQNQDANPKVSTDADHVESERKARIEKLTQQHNDLLVKLEEEKKRGKMLDKAIKASGEYKYEKPINELSLDELLEKKKWMEDLRGKLRERMREMEASQSLLLLSKSAAEEDDN